jgi:hypothetical protein
LGLFANTFFPLKKKKTQINFTFISHKNTFSTKHKKKIPSKKNKNLSNTTKHFSLLRLVKPLFHTKSQFLVEDEINLAFDTTQKTIIIGCD